MAIQPPCSPWPEALDAFVSIEAPFLPEDGSHEVAISQPAKAARSLKKARLLVGGQPRRPNFLVLRSSDRHQEPTRLNGGRPARRLYRVSLELSSHGLNYRVRITRHERDESAARQPPSICISEFHGKSTTSSSSGWAHVLLSLSRTRVKRFELIPIIVSGGQRAFRRFKSTSR